MEKEQRQKLERLTQAARRLLEQEFREQLEGRYDVLLDGRIGLAPGAHLSEQERVVWQRIVAAIAHRRRPGVSSADAVMGYRREAAFHTLNRFVALKMLEARKLVQECISRGEESTGFKEFCGLAPGLVQVSGKGYRLYIESLLDELGRQVKVLFNRLDPATLLWPRRQAFTALLELLNDPELAAVWQEDETIGWVYQYFNGEDERRQMRAESQAPRNSRELAVRNQFFTPRYVVQFLTDNSLGQLWVEMRQGATRLAELDYLVKDSERLPRPAKDPRDLRVLDPACGSGHFLLYCFDLLAGDPSRGLAGIYLEAWRAEEQPPSQATGNSLRHDYPTEEALLKAVPELILRHNLHGVDIDPRAAQGIAFIDLIRQRYDAVLMNPPFGAASLAAKREFETAYPRTKNDLYAAFVERGIELLHRGGYLGAITSRTGFFLSSFQRWREEVLLQEAPPTVFADLGQGVLDSAMVEVAAYCLRKGGRP